MLGASGAAAAPAFAKDKAASEKAASDKAKGNKSAGSKVGEEEGVGVAAPPPTAGRASGTNALHQYAAQGGLAGRLVGKTSLIVKYVEKRELYTDAGHQLHGEYRLGALTHRHLHHL